MSSSAGGRPAAEAALQRERDHVRAWAAVGKVRQAPGQAEIEISVSDEDFEILLERVMRKEGEVKELCMAVKRCTKEDDEGGW